MKFSLIVLASTMFLSLNALATTKFVCREKSDRGSAISVVLESQDQKTDLNRDGRKTKATLEIYDTAIDESAIDNLLSTSSVKGIVESSDVDLVFESEDKKISVTIYLDALTDSFLNLGDGKEIGLTCF